MNININIRADSADDYKAAIKALMDGAGMVGLISPASRFPLPARGASRPSSRPTPRNCCASRPPRPSSRPP